MYHADKITITNDTIAYFKTDMSLVIESFMTHKQMAISNIEMDIIMDYFMEFTNCGITLAK
tara:strand:- start:686 stop:868 length:183 start_codon:yes stop_codon:yes gene_type:complete